VRIDATARTGNGAIDVQGGAGGRGNESFAGSGGSGGAGVVVQTP
jgi:hypothetical protein